MRLPGDLGLVGRVAQPCAQTRRRSNLGRSTRRDEVVQEGRTGEPDLAGLICTSMGSGLCSTNEAWSRCRLEGRQEVDAQGELTSWTV